MRHTRSLLAFTALACATLVSAQAPTEPSWVGVWEGKLDGQPGLTVTLGRDTGELGGTIVFNVVAKAQGESEAHVIGHDAHVMTDLQPGPDSLSFQVTRRGDGHLLHLTLRRTGEKKAALICADCGGPSLTELTWIK